jgi:hypothetical protein
MLAGGAAHPINFPDIMKAALLNCSASTPIEIGFQDETRAGQKGAHTYIWAEIDSRPLTVRDNLHTSAYLFGAICTERPTGAAIIMPGVNTEAMNEHLKEISTQIAEGANAILICDGAGWHQTGGSLKLPATSPYCLYPLTHLN